MRPITLPLQTIYADLLQALGDDGVLAGTISRRKISGAVHVYSSEKDGAGRRQRYLGPERDPATVVEVAAVRRAAALAKVRRSSVTALKAAGIPAPPLAMGQLLEVLANAGLFAKGAVLVGTAAFQLYPCVVGAYLSAGALQTQDADIGLTQLAIRSGGAWPDLEATLKRANDSFIPKFHAAHAPPLAFQSADGFSVEVLTTLTRKRSPELVPGLGCAAQPLAFLDYLLERSIWVAALYNSGVRVRVPEPARFAVHKLIVAHERPAGSAKRGKDLLQAEQLLAAFGLVRNLDPIRAALTSARRRGPRWSKAVAVGLAAIDLPEGL